MLVTVMMKTILSIIKIFRMSHIHKKDHKRTKFGAQVVHNAFENSMRHYDEQ